ncbi:cellulose binding domain-containing protein [Streptomyces mirabilis]|uniref:cellulose binding domain-containing protein n=1 Tax=Streptomyces mirabilis TaxID=68239 RepID=UPI0036D97186
MRQNYLKYDWCSSSGTRDEQVARFTVMRDALRATGRPIVYSINPNSFHAITGATYNWGEVADLWRTTEDMLDIWQNGNTNSYPMGVGNVLDVTAPLAAQSGPGHWNDPDMLVVGRPGLSLAESRSHFALWALLAAPLMAGDDIRTMSADGSAILRNPRLLAVNQDQLGAGGRRVRDDGSTVVFAKPLSDGSVAVGLFNRGGSTAAVSTTAAQVGLSGGPFTLTDLWTGGTSSTAGQISASVPAHGVAVFRVSGGSPSSATTSRLRGDGSGRCVEVDNASTAAGATVLLDCHTAANQLWTTWAGGEIRVFGDKCLDAYNQGTTDPTRVITITGTTAIDGWSLAFTLPDGQTVISGWNADYSPPSGRVTARNVAHNATIAPGVSADIGFQAAHTGNTAPPSSYTLNGTACAMTVTAPK